MMCNTMWVRFKLSLESNGDSLWLDNFLLEKRRVYLLERINRPFVRDEWDSIRLGLKENGIAIGWTVAHFALNQSTFVNVD